MVKVNNGWQNHSIDQLEHISSQLGSPILSSPVASSSVRRPLSVHSDSTDRYFTSPGAQRSPAQFSRLILDEPYHSSQALNAQPYTSSTARATGLQTNTPSLAPAAPIAPNRSHRRVISSKSRPTLITTKIAHDTSSQPSTPARQGILRMPSQQAEKDALESLLFMSSPNNSSNVKYIDSPAGPSPLRSEFPAAAKRVIFES